MVSLSPSFSTSSSSFTAASIFAFSSASNLSPCSVKDFFTLWIMPSAALRASTSSRSALSSSAWAAASSSMRLISSSDKPEFALIVILFSLPVALSFADTCKIPLASISKVTSICGIPRGAGGMSLKLNWPRLLLPAAISRSPCNTWMVTAFWLSSAVENTWDALVGIVVFFLMSLVITPPIVSIPSDNGVTSSNNTSLTSPCNTPPWIAAPTATASSGLTSLRASLPKISFTFSCTFGIRLWPPTKITSPISSMLTPASFSAVRHGAMVRSIKSSTKDSNLVRVIFTTKCLGPEASAVM